MYSVNKLGRNYKVGVPLSDDYRHRVLELSQNHSCREVSDILGIQPSTVSNILKRYRATGQTAPFQKITLELKANYPFKIHFCLKQ